MSLVGGWGWWSRPRDPGRGIGSKGWVEEEVGGGGGTGGGEGGGCCCDC